VTAALFVLGISAYHLLRQNETDLFRRSFRMAAIIGVTGTLLVALIGHRQAQHIAQTQPTKLASMEALRNTEETAGLSLFTLESPDGKSDIVDIRIPNMLSLLVYNRFTGEVKGMEDLQAQFEQKYGPGSYIPPTIITYWSFRAMVGSGFALIAISLVALFIDLKNLYGKFPWFFKLLPWAIILPYLANSTGWILTEVGRFPWVVYGLVKLQDGVSKVVSSGMLLTSLIGFILVYGLLIVATVYLMLKFAKAGPVPTDTTEPDEFIPSLVSVQDSQ
jgi:cytochrome d ubiquinol oxidase subunit I